MFNKVVGLRTLTARPFAAHLGPRIAGGGPLVISILTLSFAKNKLPDSSPGPARRSRSERRMATETEESETQTDGDPSRPSHVCGHAAWRRPTAECGGCHDIPDPLTNILRPSPGNLPAFYQRTAAA